MECRAQGNALTSRTGDMQAALAERDAEVAAHKAQLKQMALLLAEKEQQMDRDMQVLSSETVDAVTTRQQLVEQLAVRTAELEALRAELGAMRASSGAMPRASSSSRAPSPIPTRAGDGYEGYGAERAASSSAHNSPARYGYSVASLPPAPASGVLGIAARPSTGYGATPSRTAGSLASELRGDLPPLPPASGFASRFGATAGSIGGSGGSTDRAGHSSSLAGLASPAPTGAGAGGSGGGAGGMGSPLSPGTAVLHERLQAARARFEQFKKSGGV
jgi:hypothetical protein